MRFASRSEIRIAQELEERRVLFFPLPLAVRTDTGALYEDHREPDFLVCQDGVWGILEVAYHPDRYEKDSEKDIWFKKSGILYTQHYKQRLDNLRRKDALRGAATTEISVRLGSYSASHFEGSAYTAERCYNHPSEVVDEFLQLLAKHKRQDIDVV